MGWRLRNNRYLRGYTPRQGIYVHLIGWNEYGQAVYYVGQTVDYESRYTKAEKAQWQLEDFYDVADKNKLGIMETAVMRNIERKGGVLINKYQRRTKRKIFS